jgi:RNA polymerase sigma-B factor
MFQAYARTGNVALRDRLVAAHGELASYIARRFANRGRPLDELVQVASFALLHAVERFDPQPGVDFPSYATTVIVSEIKLHLRDRGLAGRTPRRSFDLHKSLDGAIAGLELRLRRCPTIADLAAETRASEEEVLEALEAGAEYRFAWLEDPPPRRRRHTTRAAPDADGALVAPAITHLPIKEKRAVELRFLDRLAVSEIAAVTGSSAIQVSRTLETGLAQIRAVSGAGRVQP